MPELHITHRDLLSACEDEGSVTSFASGGACLSLNALGALAK
jgi:hypothetical protein